MPTALAPPAARSRTLVLSGLLIVTAASWAYLVFLSLHMSDMSSPFAMPMTSAWSASDTALMWVMWAVMMAGMMLPSATPMIITYSTSTRSGVSGLHGSTSGFVIGYLVAWSGFAALAAGAQWVLHDAALVSPMGVSTSRWLGGVLLVGAGAYQFSPFKNACLRQCRSPVGFILNEWRDGRRGAFVMGLRHGSVCIGCCWALMAVVFVLGVMNLWWVALVAAVVLFEKLTPGRLPTDALGVAFVAWGGVLLAGIAG